MYEALTKKDLGSIKASAGESSQGIQMKTRPTVPAGLEVKRKKHPDKSAAKWTSG